MDSQLLFAKAYRAAQFRRAENGVNCGIGEEVQFFLRRIAQPAKRNCDVPEAFVQAVGIDLARHCQIGSIRAGVLTVKVEPGPYMFELSLQTRHILEVLKQQCPSAKIRDIKLICAR